jgi:hypothetical protein
MILNVNISMVVLIKNQINHVVVIFIIIYVRFNVRLDIMMIVINGVDCFTFLLYTWKFFI